LHLKHTGKKETVRLTKRQAFIIPSKMSNDDNFYEGYNRLQLC